MNRTIYRLPQVLGFLSLMFRVTDGGYPFLSKLLESELPPATVSVKMQPQDELASAHAEVARLTAELASEQALSTLFLKERDWILSALCHESTRLTAELAAERDELVAERATSARLLQQRNDILQGRNSVRQHVVLSMYNGEYTSEFLDAKTPSQRADLLASISSLTKRLWDTGPHLTAEATIKTIRDVMAEHGFVFREPGEGQTGWAGYAMHIPHVGAVEQLDRVLRTHRTEMGAASWYLNELVAVLFRVGQYLEKTP